MDRRMNALASGIRSFPVGVGQWKDLHRLYCSSLKAVICPQLMLGIGLIPDDPMYHHTIVICRLLLVNDTCGVPCSYHMYHTSAHSYK